jgi:lipopolysaccharide transport system ATP-binding protein
MPPAIRVENLGKRYRLHGGGGDAYRTLRESLVRLATAPLRRRERGKEFWALRDVEFEIEPGEVVGVVGRNGAGKSTLLKILSRITKPTTGRVELFGRVGSLLEVGTGFHPELSGRENIFLNGAILGMTRRDVTAKLDDIIAFAELEQFIDTPVKRYSSGMYVRLAFSVAAHINPEILLVDEVLAVGDHAFQKKCLGQMEEVARGGRTIFFVSHQLDTLLHLCPSAMLFEGGKLVMKDRTRQVLDTYLQRQEAQRRTPLAERQDRTGKQRLRFTDTWIEDERGRRVDSVLVGQRATLVATYEVTAGAIVRQPAVSFALYTPQGVPVTRFVNVVAGKGFAGTIPARGRFECVIPRLPLNVGRYVYNVLAETGPDFETEDWVQGAGEVLVEQGDYFGTGKLIEPRFPALVDHRWRLEAL